MFSMTRPQHCSKLIAAVVNLAVSCCAHSIIDEKRQEWEVGTFTHGRWYERTQWSDSLRGYSPNAVCQPLSMCGERCNVLTHFLCVLLTFPLAMQTATTSELPTRQKEGEGGGEEERSSESEGDNDRATEEKDRYVGSARGRENEKGGACKAVSQHISNEHSGMSARQKRMYKIWAARISPSINFSSLLLHVFCADKRRNTRHLRRIKTLTCQGPSLPTNWWFNVINRNGSVSTIKCKCNIQRMCTNCTLGWITEM